MEKYVPDIYQENIYKINSLFLGFIIASIPLIVKSEKKTLIHNKSRYSSFIYADCYIQFKSVHIN